MMLQKLLLGAVGTAYALDQVAECFIYRDDIGSYWGIKGYEEQVIGVGTNHGHLSWPQYRHLGTFDSASVRRGFQVFTANCASCHGMQFRKYDLLLDKVYEQLQLSTWVADHFTIHPAHFYFKQFYFQEWDERDRYIHDYMYSRYYSVEQAKAANGGLAPPDLGKIRLRPGRINYVYNIMTGYYFKPPFGMNVPKGKHFNPYYDHMIIGMPRQLHDGMLDFADGTPASTPQMANDVTNFVCFMQRREGAKKPDKARRNAMIFWGFILACPIFYLKSMRLLRNYSTSRVELYAVRDNLGYKHWKTGMKTIMVPTYRNSIFL